MKIIFLNTWFGKSEKLFFEFLKEQSVTTDVFCFSEVSNGKKGADFGKLTNEKEVGKEFQTMVKKSSASLFREIAECLVGFEGRYDNSWDLISPKDGEIPLGLAVFVRKGLAVKSSVEVVNASEEVPHCFERIMQTVKIGKAGKALWVNSIHGVSHPGSKRDTKERLLQSSNICKILKKQKGLRILGGDFNLMPNTKSVKMIEKSGMRNLIKEFKIRETRSELSHSQYRGRIRQHFADFAFVGKGVKVKSFLVPKLNISDHLPLILEIK